MDEALETLNNIIIEGINTYIPKRVHQGRARAKPLWFNSSVKEKIKAKQKADKKAKRERTEESRHAYARARNQAKWECDKARSEFERSIAADAKSNPRPVYKYINARLKTKSVIPDLEMESGHLGSKYRP